MSVRSQRTQTFKSVGLAICSPVKALKHILLSFSYRRRILQSVVLPIAVTFEHCVSMLPPGTSGQLRYSRGCPRRWRTTTPGACLAAFPPFVAHRITSAAFRNLVGGCPPSLAALRTQLNGAFCGFPHMDFVKELLGTGVCARMCMCVCVTRGKGGGDGRDGERWGASVRE